MSKNSINAAGGTVLTTAPITPSPASDAPKPETFRLPKVGGDPHFGLGRSFYYRGEQLGYWRLIRLRERGKQRGVTLVPYDAVAKFIRARMEDVANSTGEGGEA